MAEDIRHLAQRLKGLREVLEIPIEQMAQVCETSVEHYLKMESGEADPGVYRLSRVAKKFGISLDVLLFGEEPRMVGYFVTRKGQSTQVEMRNDYKYEGLASGFKDRKVEPFFTTIDPLPEGKNRSKNCCGEFKLSPYDEGEHNQRVMKQCNYRTKSEVPVEADCCIKPDKSNFCNEHDDRLNCCRL